MREGDGGFSVGIAPFRSWWHATSKNRKLTPISRFTVARKRRNHAQQSPKPDQFTKNGSCQVPQNRVLAGL